MVKSKNKQNAMHNKQMSVLPYADITGVTHKRTAIQEQRNNHVLSAMLLSLYKPADGFIQEVDFLCSYPVLSFIHGLRSSNLKNTNGGFRAT